ncbi:MAG: MoaD/ThiS family protein [Thaumarchaeota archaeon]|nr:MoaD/ThiS family protein [Nitrososphaerota archaeon]
MEVTVKYFGLIRSIVGKKEETFSLPDGSNVKLLFAKLIAKYGQRFSELVMDPDGELTSEAIVLLDGEDVRNKDRLETTLEGSKEAHLVVVSPAALGGS